MRCERKDPTYAQPAEVTETCASFSLWWSWAMRANGCRLCRLCTGIEGSLWASWCTAVCGRTWHDSFSPTITKILPQKSCCCPSAPPCPSNHLQPWWRGPEVKAEGSNSNKLPSYCKLVVVAACVYGWCAMPGCLRAAGYFEFGGEDTANKTTSYMRGSSGSVL